MTKNQIERETTRERETVNERDSTIASRGKPNMFSFRGLGKLGSKWSMVSIAGVGTGEFERKLTICHLSSDFFSA